MNRLSIAAGIAIILIAAWILYLTAAGMQANRILLASGAVILAAIVSGIFYSTRPPR